MKFTVLSTVPFDPTEQMRIEPVPNVAELEYIVNLISQDQTPPITDLMAVPIEVITDYRGVLLYGTGRVNVYRNAPTTGGGNGLTSLPPPDTEENVFIASHQGRFNARVRFE